MAIPSQIPLPLLLLLLLPVLLRPTHAHGDSHGHPSQTSGRFQESDVIMPRTVFLESTLNSSTPAENSSFILAADRTYRRDPLDGFKKYTGGWNISNKDYWASVGLTAAVFFSIALVWFVGFGLVLLFICCCYCCCPNRSYSYSKTAYCLSLIMLILFTLAAIIGCILLYDGQGKFHSSTVSTLDYVVGQANFTVENLRNFSDDLAAAKKIEISRFLLSGDVQQRIDDAETKLNSSANQLATRTHDNSEKIQKTLDTVRLTLIIVAAAMLILVFVGFLFSICGMQTLVSILVLVGWIMITVTFILCGVFLLLHNVVADTCVSMGEWVSHPQEHTALDDILPCVDVATANESLYRSKEVTFQLVNLLNKVATNVANAKIPPSIGPPLYYNQSGQLIPLLCNPYTSDLNNRTCVPGEVDFSNASEIWRGYVCQTAVVSGNEECVSVGRLTPAMYQQMDAGVTVSRGLYQYAPFLAQLEDCTFVREAFTSIARNNCPGLRRYSRWVYTGLVIVSVAVMLSLIFWVVYAREQRHRRRKRQFIVGTAGGRAPGDKGALVG